MMIERLKLRGELFPVDSFFNWMGPDRFMEALRKFATGWGYSHENHNCSLPNDIAEDEHIPAEQIGYVEFWAYPENKEVRVPISEFLSLLHEAAAVEARLRPERAERIGELVEATARALSAPGHSGE